MAVRHLDFQIPKCYGRRLIQQPVLPYRHALRLSIQKELCENNPSVCEMNRETYSATLCTVQ